MKKLIKSYHLTPEEVTQLDSWAQSLTHRYQRPVTRSRLIAIVVRLALAAPEDTLLIAKEMDR